MVELLSLHLFVFAVTIGCSFVQFVSSSWLRRTAASLNGYKTTSVSIKYPVLFVCLASF